MTKAKAMVCERVIALLEKNKISFAEFSDSFLFWTWTRGYDAGKRDRAKKGPARN